MRERFVFPKGTFRSKKPEHFVLWIIFGLFAKGKGVWKSSTGLKFETDPLVLTFKGAAASADELNLSEVSISNNQQIETLDRLTYTFSNPIELSEGASVLIKQGDNVIHTLPLTLIDDKTAGAVISTPIELYKGQTYEVLLPESTVLLKSNKSIGNKAISLSVEGAYLSYLTAKSFSPTDGSCGLYTNASIRFDLPEGVSLKGGPHQAYNSFLYIYKDKIEENSLITSIYGNISESGDGIDWDLSEIPFEPETNYILYIPKDYIWFFGLDNRRLYNYSNNEIKVAISTPTVADSGIPQFEFNTPVVFTSAQDSQSYTEDMRLSYISTIEISLKDNNYTYNGQTYKLTRKESGFHKGYIYEVAGTEDKLVSEFSVTEVQRETTTEIYNIIQALPRCRLIEGKTYKVVIPEGLFAPQNSPALENFVNNPRFELIFTGTGSAELNPASCNIEDGAYCHEVYNVVWAYSEPLDFVVENPVADCEFVYKGVSTPSQRKISLFTLQGRSYMKVDLTSPTDGTPLTLDNDYSYVVTIPAGTICYASDPTIVNKEFSVTINGKNADPVVVAPEFVSIDFAVNGLFVTSFRNVKDEKATIRIVPDRYWEVSELTRDGNDVLPKLEEGNYTTPALKEDTEIKATLAYAGELLFSEVSGITQLPDSDVKVFTEGNDIVIEGLSGGEEIVVYSISGMVIGNHTAGKDIVRITVDKGQYIVRIGEVAVKVAL